MPLELKCDGFFFAHYLIFLEILNPSNKHIHWHVILTSIFFVVPQVILHNLIVILRKKVDSIPICLNNYKSIPFLNMSNFMIDELLIEKVVVVQYVVSLTNSK